MLNQSEEWVGAKTTSPQQESLLSVQISAQQWSESAYSHQAEQANTALPIAPDGWVFSPL